MKVKHKRNGAIREIFVKRTWHRKWHDFLYLTKQHRGGAGMYSDSDVVWRKEGFNPSPNEVEDSYYWVGSTDWEEVIEVSDNEEALMLLEKELDW